MVIKHWQGYGKVNATKVKDKDSYLHIRVSGDHEWGVVRDDEYDVFNWLVKKFDKSVNDFREFHFNYKVSVVPVFGLETETCDYIINRR